MSRPLDNEGNPYDPPAAWNYRPRRAPHFDSTTAAAYKRGDYKDIPNDELGMLHRGIIIIVVTTASDESMVRMESVEAEILRRIKEAGIELV